jgi:hypothetical protein
MPAVALPRTVLEKNTVGIMSSLVKLSKKRKLWLRNEPKLEGWDEKRTTRPTPYMMMKKFTGLLVVRRGNERLLKPALSGVQRAYLRALNLPEEVFTNPRVPI